MYPPLITYNVPFWNCFGMSLFLIMYPFEIIFEVPPLCALSISYNVPLFKLFLKCHISYNVPFWKFSGYAGGVHYRTNYCTQFCTTHLGPHCCCALPIRGPSLSHPCTSHRNCLVMSVCEQYAKDFIDNTLVVSDETRAKLIKYVQMPQLVRMLL